MKFTFEVNGGLEAESPEDAKRALAQYICLALGIGAPDDDLDAPACIDSTSYLVLEAPRSEYVAALESRL